MSEHTTNYSQRLTSAATEYVNRRDRFTHPVGHFDRAKRFYPAESEARACCNDIRSPSRRFPFSYMTHCRTMIHVAHLFDVEVADLRGAIREREV
jgi:hypothetical protein